MHRCYKFVLCVIILPATVLATYRYYSNMQLYGTGDTFISAYHGHGGPRIPGRKWNIECMDGEALVGIQDFSDDFEKLQSVWCKFMFSRKPSSQGVYPYYPSCHVRDFGLPNQQFCFDAMNSERTINTFMTGLWDNEYQFWVYRAGPGINGDDLQPFKCCKTPNGYYIDYVSCYYQPTHDSSWEYYDSPSHFIVSCATGFVMTGIAKRRNPWEPGDLHIEWIQCCRVGFGAQPVYQQSPVIQPYARSGRPAFYAQQAPDMIPTGYAGQYRAMMSNNMDKSNRTKRGVAVQDCDENYNVRFTGKGIPVALKSPAANLIRSHNLGFGVSS